jgi:archaellum component FlaC
MSKEEKKELKKEVKDLKKEIQEAKVEIERWKNVAGYLAECHAATAEDLPKSYSRTRMLRYRFICQSAVELLSRTEIVPVTSKFPDAIERCRAIVEELESGYLKNYLSMGI